MKKLIGVPPLVLACFLCGCTSSKQAHFASASDAVTSFVSALRANDNQQLKHILGREGDELLSSGDAVADQEGREEFLAAYDARHEIAEGAKPDSPVTLSIGETDWPFPIPIVKGKSGWYFDTADGKDEIINRRIGRNELASIQVCLAIGDAERDYAERDPQRVGIPVYAEKFISTPGKQDGLYWKAHEWQLSSPLGVLVAEAAEQGYTSAKTEAGEPRPYHGYYYRLLKSQGPDAPGGALDYVINGQMIGGFGVVAYPADYGNSGVMTFITNHAGIVYQKDLGPKTAASAKSMQSFNPGPGWARVDQSP